MCLPQVPAKQHSRERKACVFSTSTKLKHSRNGKARETEGLCVHYKRRPETLSKWEKACNTPSKCMLETLSRRASLFLQAHENSPQALLEALLRRETCMFTTSVCLKHSESRLVHLLQKHTGNTPGVFITSAGSNHSRNAKACFHHKRMHKTFSIRKKLVSLTQTQARDTLERVSLCVHHKRILRYFEEARTCVAPQAHA